MKTNCNSFTFVEVMIGIALILFILAGMNSIFGIGIRGNKKAEGTYIALGLARQVMERSLARDFDSVISTGQIVYNEFTYRTDVIQNYQNNAGKKLVTVTVAGPDIKDVKLDCIISNPVIGQQVK